MNLELFRLCRVGMMATCDNIKYVNDAWKGKQSGIKTNMKRTFEHEIVQQNIGYWSNLKLRIIQLVSAKFWPSSDFVWFGVLRYFRRFFQIFLWKLIQTKQKWEQKYLKITQKRKRVFMRGSILKKISF